jgi:Fe-S cluster biogenesis protein NfuA
MPVVLEDQEFHRRLERLETLLHEVEQLKDRQTRERVREIVQTILDLHGIGLERIFAQIASRGETGRALVDGLARDELVGNLLLLHGLHPLDLQTRVRQALDKVRPYLRSHGGNVELLAVDEGVVRLRMVGSCEGCPSSAMTLKLAIEAAIHEMAPDVGAIEVEGVAAAAAASPQTFVPLERLCVPSGQKSTR